MRRGLYVLGLLLLSCSERSGGDPHSDLGVPPPAGKDMRIKDVADPTKPEHPNYLVAGNSVSISGAIVVAVDTFDETNNGKSIGTIYVQDLGSKDPYSGTSLFSPSFVPGNLKVSANDVIDLHGQFTEAGNIGTAVFAPGVVLPQMSRPTATFRFEVGAPPPPVEIDVNDLADYAKGRQWLNMIVKVNNITLTKDMSGASESGGRLSIDLTQGTGPTPKCADPFPKPPSLTNELFDLSSLAIPKGTVLKSITGVVTFFCNLHISPRNANDIER